MKLYAVKQESKHLRQLARESIEARNRKSSLPEPWRIEVHDPTREVPAPALDVDLILTASLPNGLLGKK